MKRLLCKGVASKSGLVRQNGSAAENTHKSEEILVRHAVLGKIIGTALAVPAVPGATPLL